MNIQKISLAQNFGAKIGPRFQKEIDRKRLEIVNLPRKETQISLKKFDEIIDTIKQLCPTYNGSPVTVEITYRMHRLNGHYKNLLQKIKGEQIEDGFEEGIKETLDYVVKNEKGWGKSFFRINDGQKHFYRYKVLIDKLKKLEETDKKLQEKRNKGFYF